MREKYRNTTEEERDRWRMDRQAVNRHHVDMQKNRYAHTQTDRYTHTDRYEDRYRYRKADIRTLSRMHFNVVLR